MIRITDQLTQHRKKPNVLSALIFCLSASSVDCYAHQTSKGYCIRSSVCVRNAVKEDYSVKSREEDIWTSRRKIIRSTLKPIVKRRLERDEKARQSDKVALNESKENVDESTKKKKPTGLLVSAFFIAVSATVLRLGGRTAFVQMLGLDFVTGSGIKDQVNDFVSFFNSMGDTTQYAAIFLAWLVAKALCIDALTIVLALSSGVLFGGIFEGTAVSVICSSTASLCIFFLSRYFLREKSEKEIARRPAYRAVDRACAKEGFKTVFTLRLSPLLPIPIGAYNYLYGATSVSPLDFIAGISLGSVKPYLLDSYLGLFGKSLIDEKDILTSGGQYGDWALLGFISVVILVGAFATEVAASTWEEIQKENDLDLLEKGATDDMQPLMAPEDTSETGAIRNTLASSQFFRMLGVDSGDLGKVPGWLLRAAGDLFSAQNRVDSVINDEISAVTYELEEGLDMGWDLATTTTVPLKVTATGDQVQEGKVEAQGGSLQKSFDSMTRLNYNYPGQRQINAFEEVVPDMTNIAEYTYESLVFSFSLMSAMGTLLADPEPKSELDSGMKTALAGDAKDSP